MRIFQEKRDHVGEAAPALGLALQLRPAAGRELVKLRIAPGLRLRPLGGEELFVLQAMQRGVERPLLHLQGIARYLLDALRDGISVNGSKRDHSQDQEVEGSLGKIELR